jgi:hypothetical protein
MNIIAFFYIAALTLCVDPTSQATESISLAPAPLAQGRWSFSNGGEFPGAKGTLSVDAKRGVSLAYDFTGGGAYVAAYRDLDAPDIVGSISFRLENPRPRQITVRVFDRDGQVFQKSVGSDHAGWQAFTCGMNRWTGHYGGPNDGIPRQPVKRIGILVENGGRNDAGELLIADVAYVRGSAGQFEPAGPLDAEYTVTEFQDDAGFGTAGGQLAGGRWRIDFAGVSNARLGHSLSLLGKPRSMTLTLDSPAKGHLLKIRLGSHFQNFETTAGTLAGGRQTFTVPMPPRGWTHYGGENDGEVRHPLRLTAIILERGEGPAQAVEIQLLDLKCTTTVEPENAVHMRARIEEERTSLVGATPATSAALQWPPPGRRRFLRVHCQAQNLLPAVRQGPLKLELTDWQGGRIAERDTVWIVPGGKSADFSQTVAIDAGLNFAQARFTFEPKDAPPAEAAAAFTRPLDDPGDAALKPESPWGMGVYLYRYPDNEAGHRRMDAAAAMAQAAGVKWSREEFGWARTEPRRGQFDFAFYDTVVDTATRHGISVYGLLSYWSSWTKPYTHEGIDDFCAWAKVLVGRYKDRIHHWEIYNEPNIFFWSGPRDLYPVLVKKCYVAIKEVDPGAHVLAISTAGIDRKFIQMCLDADAPFDVLTIHPYRSLLSEKAFMDELAATAALVDNRHVWITEMGWSTQLGGVSEREQAQLLARCYLAAVASGACQNVSWYNFRNDGDDTYYNEHNFGVLHGDLRPKPAYRALATVCRTLSEGEPTPRTDFGQHIHALQMDDGLALWTTGQSLEVELRKRAADVRVVNLMGEPLPLEERRGRLTLTLQPACPVFVTGDVEPTGTVRMIETAGERGVIHF